MINIKRDQKMPINYELLTLQIKLDMYFILEWYVLSSNQDKLRVKLPFLRC